MHFEGYLNQTLVLSTGRRIDGIYRQLLNPSFDGTKELLFGYDDPVLLEDEEPLTREERREIADHYIKRWNAWAGE